MKNSGKPLNQNRLQELALRYVSRYATTRHKLASYLGRKVQERGWDDETAADYEVLVERFAELGYIDDALFAKSKAASLTRRGYGARRVSQALYQSGIEEADGQEAINLTNQQKWQAAETFARKRSIGPFAPEQQEREICQKQLAAFIRAGHSYDVASRFVFAMPGDVIDDC